MTGGSPSGRVCNLPVMALPNPHVDEQVGQRILALRTELCLSQRELDTPGFSYSYISRVESGTRTPSLSSLVVFAEVFRLAAWQQLDNILPLRDDDEPRFVAWVERLQWLVVNCSALYLLTGDPDSQCLVCGRHEHEGVSNGHSNGSTRR